MTTFIFRNGRPDHMVGYHDDILWGLAMALVCLLILPLGKLKKIKINLQQLWIVG